MAYIFGPQDNANLAQAQWTLLGQLIENTGVGKGLLGELAVTVVSGLTVQAAAGQAWLVGFFFQTDVAVSATLNAADPSLPRIDRLVVHADLAAHTADIRKLTGTPAASPTPPALTQTGTVWEISLAKIAVAAGASSLTAGNITDERVMVGANKRAVIGPHSAGQTTISYGTGAPSSLAANEIYVQLA